MFSIDFIQILDYIGSFAFAISGFRLASAKKFDWFGAFIVGMAPAVGGGTLRDIMLNLPPFWLKDPMYLLIIALAFVFVISCRKFISKLDRPIFTFDAIGLAVFTVVGIERTLGVGYPFWVAIIMGTTTGALGGIIRDVLVGEVPLIFRKEIYAMACLFGGLIYYICSLLNLPHYLTQALTAVCVFDCRVICANLKIALPVLKQESD